MRVTVVIVNWNTGKLLAQCLQSLAALPEKGMIAEVMVVDNASRDDSLTRAKRVETGVPTTVIALPKNIGFAAANNMAIRRRRDTTSHVLLLNPDTEVKAGAIAAGLHELKHTAKAGVVGLKLVNPDGTTQPSVRNLPTLPIFIFLFLKLHHAFAGGKRWRNYMQAKFDYDQRQAVEQVMGAVFFIKQEALERVGLLDEAFWVWFEEVDFCQRVWEAGYEVVYTPAGAVLHYGGASFNQLVGLRKSLPFLRSALHYAYKHLGLTSYCLLLVLWPLAVLLSLPASFSHMVQRDKNLARI